MTPVCDPRRLEISSLTITGTPSSQQVSFRDLAERIGTFKVIPER